MKAQNEQIEWTDLLFIPAGLIVAYLLGKWLPTAFAVALAVILLCLVFSLFEPRKVSFKRILFAALVGGLVSFILVVLFKWPY